MSVLLEIAFRSKMGKRWGRDGEEMGKRWGRDGEEMGKRWGRDEEEMGRSSDGWAHLGTTRDD
jgi:hypothetical protein